MKNLFRSCRVPIAVLALGVCAAFGFTQTPKPAADPVSVPSKDVSPAQKKLDDILARYDKAYAEWKALADKVTSQKEYDAVAEKIPGDAFLDEIEVVAQEAKGTDTAARAWVRYAKIAASLRSTNQVAKAVKILVEDHVTSPQIADVPEMLGGAFKPAKAEELLRRMIEKSPERSVQASSMLALGMRLMNEKKPTPERVAEGRALLEKVRKDYAGIKSSRDEEYAAVAGAQLYELEHLQIGQTPDDFETVDENGVKFKLSDYRGKVVVIDFWGNW
jgi:hypothetical protein